MLKLTHKFSANFTVWIVFKLKNVTSTLKSIMFPFLRKVVTMSVNSINTQMNLKNSEEISNAILVKKEVIRCFIGKQFFSKWDLNLEPPTNPPINLPLELGLKGGKNIMCKTSLNGKKDIKCPGD